MRELGEADAGETGDGWLYELLVFEKRIAQAGPEDEETRQARYRINQTGIVSISETLERQHVL
jgi:hypothetical protein